MSGLFPSGGQSIGASASASASFLPMNIQVDFFRIDWSDLLAVQGPLKSLLQPNLKASVFQCSAFFMVQLSHPYMTTGKTIALITVKLVLLSSSLTAIETVKFLEPDNLNAKPGFTTDRLYDVGKFLNCSLPQFPHL